MRLTWPTCLRKPGRGCSRSLNNSPRRCAEAASAAKGLNLFLSDGSAAGQDVFHTHLHVLPRFAGDGIKLRFGQGHDIYPERAELDRIAEQIKQVL